MKSSTSLALIFSALLIVLCVGTLLLPTTMATLTADSVKIEPKKMDLDDPDEIVTVWIRFDRAREINADTVLLEGSLPPISGSNYTGDKPPEFVCDFDGYSVRDIMWLKIYHVGMNPNPQGNYVVDLTITGKLYDGTSFTGEGHIQVKPRTYSSPPPPPPP